MAEGKFIPILFSTPMVQAILEGRKTMTRRVVKFPKDYTGENVYPNEPYGLKYDSNILGGTIQRLSCSYGLFGDVLWVRETFCLNTIPTGWPYHYKANNDTFTNPENEKWMPNIFMPKTACRIFLKVTNIRIERLQDITEEDAKAEGIEIDHISALGTFYKSYQYKKALPFFQAKSSFKTLWEKINDKDSWNENPWVWVISFKQIEKPENFIQ